MELQVHHSQVDKVINLQMSKLKNSSEIILVVWVASCLVEMMKMISLEWESMQDKTEADCITANKTEAAHYFKMGADNGDSEAMYDCAEMLFDGDGIPKNVKESIKYYKMSADNGDEKGMFKYAALLYSGEGVQKNRKEAAKNFKMSADKGFVQSIRNYGIMCRDGDGINVNGNEFAKYLKYGEEN